MTENERENALLALYEAERGRISGLRTEAKLTGDYDSPVFGKGCLLPRLMLVGEAPGSEEAKAGKPFVGKAGKQLDELLALAGIERERVFVTNAVKFRPTKQKTRTVSNRTPNTSEIMAALPVLHEEIRIIAPAIIATLGNTPLRAVSAAFGQKCPTIGGVHGSVIELSAEGGTVRLFPLYHPASCIYQRGLLSTLEEDILKLKKLLNEEGDF